MSALTSLFRIIIFLLIFTIEVRVKAETQMEPVNCLNQGKEACAVRTLGSSTFELKLDGADVYIDRSSAIIRENSSSLRLVDGTVWVRAREPFFVRTEFGSVKVEAGDFWVSRTSDQVTVSAINAVVEILARGATDALRLEPGLQNWIGRVGLKGQAQTGVPVAIELRAHLGRWARLYPGKQSEFEKEAKIFGQTWVRARESASALHAALYERKVAALNEENARREFERRRVEARDRELSEMLRRRVLEGADE